MVSKFCCYKGNQKRFSAFCWSLVGKVEATLGSGCSWLVGSPQRSEREHPESCHQGQPTALPRWAPSAVSSQWD